MSESTPRVSVGIPVFNGEDFLTETLDCYLAQTYTDFEIVIADNASTDRTLEICKAYAAKDQRVRVHRNETNMGASYNYNRVFELSSGEFFKWGAHDDLCGPEYLELCVELLDNEPDAIMCYPKTVAIDQNGDALPYEYEDRFDLRSSKPVVRFRQSWDLGILCQPVFGLIRTSVLSKTGLIGNYSSSDMVLLRELAMFGKCYEIPVYLAFKRLHPENSVAAYPSLEERTYWFDPKAKARLSERRRHFFEYLKAIGRADLGIIDKTQCLAELARYYTVSSRFGDLARDIKERSGGTAESSVQA